MLQVGDGIDGELFGARGPTQVLHAANQDAYFRAAQLCLNSFNYMTRVLCIFHRSIVFKRAPLPGGSTFQG